MVAAWCSQFFNIQILVNPDHIPGMDHTSIAKTYPTMSPVHRTAFGKTQTVIEDKSSPRRFPLHHCISIELSRFFSAVTTKYLLFVTLLIIFLIFLFSFTKMLLLLFFVHVHTIPPRLLQHLYKKKQSVRAERALCSCFILCILFSLQTSSVSLPKHVILV